MPEKIGLFRVSRHIQLGIGSQTPTGVSSNDTLYHAFETIQSHREAYEVGRHHHEQIADGSDTTQHPVCFGVVLPLIPREQQCSHCLWEDEE